MRHARIDFWSRGTSAIHRLDATAKIPVAVVLLICIATLGVHALTACLLYLLLLLAVATAARLPVVSILWTAAAVLPFALCFAAMAALAGDGILALWLVIRSYLSALAALLLVATTPMPALMAGLERLRVPRFLVQVMQFLYRYLLVLIDEATAMRQAASSRAGSLRTMRFRQAGAALGALFARSHARAQAIHRAMLSRGFDGHLPVFRRARLPIADAGFAGAASLVVLGVRVVCR